MSQAERERERLALINAPVTIRTDRAVPLTEFMNIVSFSAPSNISYYVASGIDANVYGSFVDMPLGELLDNVLGPLGLTWSLDANNFLTVSSRLLPQTYRLNADQMNKVRALLDGGVLQQLVWGRPTPPSEGVEMTLDERSRLLTVVGSEQQIAKVTAFINSLESARTPDLETRIYRIRPELGPRVKSMIDALLAGRTASPFALQRDVIIAGSEMIVRDTPENLTRIEELLLDEAFIGRVSDQQLDIANFSLVPRNLENREAEELQTATARVVEAVKTFLYARVGEEAANRQGRRLWYDPAALQLTLVDTPDNLSRIGSYLGSLPELKAEQQEKYIALKHVLAADMASEIAQILGIETAATGGGGENQTCRRLSRGDQFEFQGMRIRLVRVEENDPQDRDDDSAELSLVTSTQSSQLNLREFDTVFFEDYQITAERINPSGGGGGNVRGGGGQTGRRGDGTAEICIEYTPPAIPPIP
jgi:hypothetical protein